MKLTEIDFLSDLFRHPGGHCRKPHYWFKRETRHVYFIVWRAFFRGHCTCPLLKMKITDDGYRYLKEATNADR